MTPLQEDLPRGLDLRLSILKGLVLAKLNENGAS